MHPRTSQLLLVAILCSVAGLAAAAEGPRVAVMNIKAEKGIGPSTIRILNDLLVTRVNERGIFASVIGEQDIASMLQMEEQKQMLTGCADEMCLAEIGGALGVDYMFAASIGMMGETAVFSAKLLNTNRASVAGRGSLIVPPDEEALMMAVGDLVDEIMEQAFPQAGMIGAAAWSMAAIGAASLIAGAVVGGLGLVDQDELNAMERYDPGRSELRDDIRTKGLVADVLLGFGAAAAVTSLILFLVEGGAESSASAAVTPILGEGRAGLALGLSF